jgi:hypothetical protein
LKELLLVLVFFAAVAWLVSRIRRGNVEVQQASQPKTLKSTSAFHAVSVKYSSDACNAAKAMTGNRILATAAPRLPLPECDAAECRCGFAHHDDRRSGEDRRNPFGSRSYGALAGNIKTERRDRKERRRHANVANF